MLDIGFDADASLHEQPTGSFEHPSFCLNGREHDAEAADYLRTVADRHCNPARIGIDLAVGNANAFVPDWPEQLPQCRTIAWQSCTGNLPTIALDQHLEFVGWQKRQNHLRGRAPIERHGAPPLVAHKSRQACAALLMDAKHPLVV